jgi:S-formylglutathione hydrolase
LARSLKQHDPTHILPLSAQKGSFLGPAAKEDIAILFTDTSPRGAGIEGEDDDWDFGTGAGFYLNATNPKYARHYNMSTHIQLEIPQILETAALPIDLTRMSIFGHSMGGHGALCTYLASKTRQYRSASAFAPISNPVNAPWGQKAFVGYLQGGIEEAKEQYDATELISKHTDPVHILIDYGTSDGFYIAGQLLPENFLRAARQAGYDEMQVRVREQEGYDHSYFFVSTFAEDHIHFHANFLKA